MGVLNYSRLEVRCDPVLSAKELAKQFPEWSKLNTICIGLGYRQEKIMVMTPTLKFWISYSFFPTYQNVKLTPLSHFGAFLS